MLRLEVELGDRVDARAVLGNFSDIYGRRNLAVRTPVAGLVIGLNRSPLINQGDALVHIAEEWDAEAD
jgi:predicted deacylase